MTTVQKDLMIEVDADTGVPGEMMWGNQRRGYPVTAKADPTGGMRLLSGGVDLGSATTGRTITGSDTAVAEDAGMLTTSNAAGAHTFTIPNDSTVAWTGNATLSIYQKGAGAPSFAAGSGVTLRSPSGVATATQYGVIAAMRVGANEWTLL